MNNRSRKATATASGVFFEVGDTVRLKGKKRTAKIERFYSDIEGGLRLDKKLRGFWSWNVLDLEKVCSGFQGLISSLNGGRWLMLVFWFS
jgi:hypothetical protein